MPIPIIVGIVLGCTLFIAKLGGIYLITGGKKGIDVWFIGHVEPWNWIQASLVRKGILDFLLSGMVAKVFAGSVIGMVGAVTFALVSMTVLGSSVIFSWGASVRERIKSKWEGVCYSSNMSSSP